KRGKKPTASTYSINSCQERMRSGLSQSAPCRIHSPFSKAMAFISFSSPRHFSINLFYLLSVSDSVFISKGYQIFLIFDQTNVCKFTCRDFLKTGHLLSIADTTANDRDMCLRIISRHHYPFFMKHISPPTAYFYLDFL